MKLRLLGAGALVAAIGTCASASADIVYTVDQVIGTGSVTGTITTDGTTGVLSTSDILTWSLTLTGPGASSTITNTDPGAYKDVVGNDLTATATAIWFNFSGATGDYFLLQDGAYEGTQYWCNMTQPGAYACEAGKSDVPVYFTDPSSQFNTGVVGNKIIAGSVPEPSTWAMMLLGFAGLGYAGYRGRRSAVAAAL